MASSPAERPLHATSLVDASTTVPGARRQQRGWDQPTASEVSSGAGLCHREMSSHCATQAQTTDKILIPAATAAEKQAQQQPWLLAVPWQYEWQVYYVLLWWIFLFLLTKCCSPGAAGLTCLIPSTPRDARQGHTPGQLLVVYCTRSQHH